MPVASGSGLKYWLQDHDTAYLDQTPVQNTWYTILEEDDVRLIYHAFMYDDDEHNMPTYEIRWTLDGHVYEGGMSDEAAGTQGYAYRVKYSIAEALPELGTQTTRAMCMYDVPKHALHAKLEARITNAVGTNPHLYQWCLYETEEIT